MILDHGELSLGALVRDSATPRECGRDMAITTLHTRDQPLDKARSSDLQAQLCTGLFFIGN